MKTGMNTNRITSFICFDIETTGLNPYKDKIIEIGALKVQDGKIIDKFEEFIHPGIKLPKLITDLTGIDDSMVADAETEDIVIKRFIEFIDNDILIGHNVKFDYSFVKVAASRLGIDFNKYGIDTLDLSRRLHPDLESRSLSSMCSYYSINNEHAHRAYNDAKATALLYVNLSNQFFDKTPEIFCPKLFISKVKKTKPITNKQKNYLNDLIKYHNISIVQTIEALSQSEASKLIDGIIYKYGRIK